MLNTITVHPSHDSLVFIGGSLIHQYNVAVFVGQVVPVGSPPTHVVNIEATAWNVRGQGSLGEEANPCIGGSTCSLAIGVDDGSLIVKNDVLIGS